MSTPSMRLDPTRTATLRRQFVSEIRRRYRLLKTAIVKLIYELDVMGLNPPSSPFRQLLGGRLSNVTSNAEGDFVPPQTVVTAPAGIQYETNPNKVKRFRAWLRDQMESTLAGDDVIQAYIDQGYQKGTERAFDDLRRGKDPSPGDERADLRRQGSKDEFVRIAMTKGATVEKVKLLAGRTFSELEGVNAKMAARMSRLLVDALVNGWSPSRAARELVAAIGIEQSRAEAIVRTELVRAHSEGQLDALEQLGESSVGVLAEWSTAHDNRVCPKCSALDGQSFKIAEARGMLPMHPNCRCAWIPLKRKRGEK